jgi:hypothetical protein
LIELPVKDPCDLCVAARDESWKIIDESEHTLTVINPWQFEIGQCCVITRRHVATLPHLAPRSGPMASGLPSRHVGVEGDAAWQHPSMGIK